MIETLAIGNYRSLRDLVVPLGQLTVITGANGVGKSNLYRALRLLAESARGGVVPALALEGGLDSMFWAGPESFSRGMKSGQVPVQGGPKSGKTRLRLGFAGSGFSYAVSIGLPPSSGSDGRAPSLFTLDPEIKAEHIWQGPCYRPASTLIDRKGPLIRTREGRSWETLAQGMPTYTSMLSEVADPNRAPEILEMREYIKSWRFYDQFRTDRESPIRNAQISTRTPVLDHEGHRLAAALQTIREIGEREALEEAIDQAFPGARLTIDADANARFTIQFHQPGLLRPLTGAELSDGTLRFLLLAAALLTPRPPELLVLNEPETSLHPDLLPALASLIGKACEHSQVWVVSHAEPLVEALKEHPACLPVQLEKELGETVIKGQGWLDRPPWHWPD